MIKDGEPEPALVGPWTIVLDKKITKPLDTAAFNTLVKSVFFFKQKTAYEIGLGIPAEPLFRSGHKAASDVRDEFVSVTEKLMDELAQCYNVLPQLDINNTIDHRPEG